MRTTLQFSIPNLIRKLRSKARRIKAGDCLPSQDNVLRYIQNKHVDKDTHMINGHAFLSKLNEIDNGPSVNWMEFYSGSELEQISEIKSVRRLKSESRARVAILNIVKTKEALSEMGLLIDFIYDPLKEEKTDRGKFPPDPSHSFIKGIPTSDDVEAELIGDIIRDTIVKDYPDNPHKNRPKA